VTPDHPPPPSAPHHHQLETSVAQAHPHPCPHPGTHIHASTHTGAFVTSLTCVINAKEADHRHLLGLTGPDVIAWPLQAVVNLQLLEH